MDGKEFIDAKKIIDEISEDIENYRKTKNEKHKESLALRWHRIEKKYSDNGVDSYYRELIDDGCPILGFYEMEVVDKMSFLKDLFKIVSYHLDINLKRTKARNIDMYVAMIRDCIARINDYDGEDGGWQSAIDHEDIAGEYFNFNTVDEYPKILHKLRMNEEVTIQDFIKEEKGK